MILGSALGLVAYYQLGWYTAALIGAAVSMATVIISTRLAPRDFDWNRLNESAAHNTTEVRPA